MQNYKQSTDTIHAVVANTVKGGDLVKVGALYGVAVTDSNGTDLIALKTSGVFTLTKTAATDVIAQGAKVYAAAGAVNATNTNDFVGYAFAATANGDTTMEVGLMQ